MSFNINDFKSRLSNKGVQTLNSFLCLIHPPSSIKNQIANELQFRVNSINWPGVSLELDQIKHKGYGLNEARVIGASYEDIVITVIADAKGEINNFFMQWLELIFPTNNENSNSDIEFIKYPQDIYGGLEIVVFDKTGEEHTRISFVDPFISNLGAVQMAWENQNQIMYIPVSFKYRSYKINPKHQGTL